MKTNVRLANETDAELITDWMLDTPDNMFDPAQKITEYPSLRTVVVETNDRPSLFAPFHPVLMVESLAHKPGIGKIENARALRKLQDHLDEVARHYGMAEVWWGCKDETLIKLATRQGYEVVNYTMLKKKV